MQQDIFDPAFVKAVFDKCGTNYRWWSRVASFGFVTRWRRQCIALLPELHDVAIGYDLMAGTGEAWPELLARYPGLKSITAIDISSAMHTYALERLHSTRTDRIRFIEADVLATDMQVGAADFVIATFGLKTFSQDQQRRLAAQIARTLKPGGSFALVEACDPQRWALRPLYRVYLDGVLPVIERLFLRGAKDFAMLGVYTKHFKDCSHFAACLRAEGLDVRETPLFFGCAQAVSGSRAAR